MLHAKAAQTSRSKGDQTNANIVAKPRREARKKAATASIIESRLKEVARKAFRLGGED